MIGLLILFAVALVLLLALLTAMLAWEMRHPPCHTAAYAIARGLAADPGEIGLPFESWTLDRPDGAKLPVWDIANPKSNIQNPKSLTAVFIHGWGHSRIDSLARIRPFDELCDRMIMYDLRGHGEAAGASHLGDAEDADLLDLLGRVGPGPFVLVGHSMGAVIALRAALHVAACPDTHGRIAGVVAYGPYCEFHRSLIGRLKVAGFPARPITDLALFILRMTGIRPTSADPEKLGSLQVPLLVIHGAEDAVAPPAHGRRIVQAAAGSTLIEIPAARHTDAHCVDAKAHDEAVRMFVVRITQQSLQPV